MNEADRQVAVLPTFDDSPVFIGQNKKDPIHS